MPPPREPHIAQVLAERLVVVAVIIAYLGFDLEP